MTGMLTDLFYEMYDLSDIHLCSMPIIDIFSPNFDFFSVFANYISHTVYSSAEFQNF